MLFFFFLLFLYPISSVYALSFASSIPLSIPKNRGISRREGEAFTSGTQSEDTCGTSYYCMSTQYPWYPIPQRSVHSCIQHPHSHTGEHSVLRSLYKKEPLTSTMWSVSPSAQPCLLILRMAPRSVHSRVQHPHSHTGEHSVRCSLLRRRSH